MVKQGTKSSCEVKFAVSTQEVHVELRHPLTAPRSAPESTNTTGATLFSAVAAGILKLLSCSAAF